MSDVVIKIENLSKEYRYGTVSQEYLFRDLQSWWAKVRGKEDPNERIGSKPLNVESLTMSKVESLKLKEKEQELLKVDSSTLNDKTEKEEIEAANDVIDETDKQKPPNADKRSTLNTQLHNAKRSTFDTQPSSDRFWALRDINLVTKQG